MFSKFKEVLSEEGFASGEVELPDAEVTGLVYGMQYLFGWETLLSGWCRIYQTMRTRKVARIVGMNPQRI